MNYWQRIELEVEEAWAHANRPEAYSFSDDGNTDSDGTAFDEYDARYLYERDMRRIAREDEDEFWDSLDEKLALIDELDIAYA